MSARSALLALAFAGVLTASINALAQDAGVSGIPPGPGNVGGLNNAVNDPSGMGNAAKVPPLPPPSLKPVPVPSGFPPAASRISPTPRLVGRRATRHATSRYRRSPATNAAISENDKLLDRKLRSICRGC